MNKPQIAYLLFAVFGQLNSSADGPETLSVASVYGEKWYAGDKILVMRLVEARLQKNPSDLASQLVLLDYSMSFMDTEALKILIPLIRGTAAHVQSPRFLEKKQILELTLRSLEALIPDVTEQMREDEAYKGALPHKPLSVLSLIEALEADGLVAKFSDEEKTLLTNTVSTHMVNSTTAGAYQRLRSLPLTKLLKAFPAPRLPLRQNEGKMTSRMSANGEPTSPTPSSIIIIVLTVVALGFLWLSVRRKQPRG